LSNLTVSVENLHIRYEDLGWRSALLTRGQRFCVGVTLSKFCLETTDEGPVKKFSYENVEKKDMINEEGKEISNYSIKHKLAEVHDIAVYWDSGTEIMLSQNGIIKSDPANPKIALDLNQTSENPGIHNREQNPII